MEDPTFRARHRQSRDRLRLVAMRWAIAIIACAGFLTLFLWALPAWLTLHPRLGGAERHKAINDARLGIAAILAVLGTVGGLRYTIRTYRLSKRGQVADQYTKAIEQLSNASGVIRIGGIYALEQTTRQADEYQHTVIDVLASFVRIRTSWRARPAPEGCSPSSGHPDSQADSISPESDIRVALDVLRRLVQVAGKRGLDLTGSNLAGADLMRMYLLDARLNGANLTGAKLNEAYLVGADLRGAQLKDAQLYRANLTDVTIWSGQISPETLADNDVRGRESVQWANPSTTLDVPTSATSRRWLSGPLTDRLTRKRRPPKPRSTA